jgi:membrane protease YdiL (CAAX protease family)
MSERRKMGVGDWMDAAINVVIGVFLGSVIYGLAQLVASGSWLMAMILILLGGGLFLIMVLSDKLLDRLFPTWIRSAKNPQPQSPKPLLRVLSLPLGFMLGVVLALLAVSSGSIFLEPSEMNDGYVPQSGTSHSKIAYNGFRPTADYYPARDN